MIFNIVEDTVIRQYEFLLGSRAETTFVQFYADDGMLHGHSHEDVQFCGDVLTEVFARMGLKINASKTEALNTCCQNNNSLLGRELIWVLAIITYHGGW
jgi:hypothetical protein